MRRIVMIGSTIFAVIAATGLIMGGAIESSAAGVETNQSIRTNTSSGSNEGTPLVVSGKTAGDVVEVEAPVAPGGYPELVLEAGKPVRINFKAAAADLNACNNEIVIPEWDIRKPLEVGDNYVEFTPTETGTFTYACWMGMIRSDITVIESDSEDAGEVGAMPLPESADIPGGCGMMSGFGGSSTAGGCCGGW